MTLTSSANSDMSRKRRLLTEGTSDGFGCSQSLDSRLQNSKQAVSNTAEYANLVTMNENGEREGVFGGIITETCAEEVEVIVLFPNMPVVIGRNPSLWSGFEILYLSITILMFPKLIRDR